MTKKRASSRRSRKSSGTGTAKVQADEGSNTVEKRSVHGGDGEVTSSRSLKMKGGRSNGQEVNPSRMSQRNMRKTRSSQGKATEEVRGCAERQAEEDVKDSERTDSVDITDTPTVEEEELHRQRVNLVCKQSASHSGGKKTVPVAGDDGQESELCCDEHEEDDYLTSDNDSISAEDRVLMEQLRKENERKKKEQRRHTPNKRSLSMPSKGDAPASRNQRREDAIDDCSRLQGCSYERSKKHKPCGRDRRKIPVQSGTTCDEIDEITPVRQVVTVSVVDENEEDDDNEEGCVKRKKARLGGEHVVRNDVRKKPIDGVGSQESSGVAVSPPGTGKKMRRNVRQLYGEVMLKFLPELKERFNCYTVQSVIMSSIVAVWSSVVDDDCNFSNLVTIVDRFFGNAKKRQMTPLSMGTVGDEKLLCQLHERSVKNSLIHSLKGFAGRRAGQGL